jgi:hypothetical protein
MGTMAMMTDPGVPHGTCPGQHGDGPMKPRRQYSSHITAAAASGGSVHTPVGFLMDVERYDVTVNSLVLLS